MIANNFRIGFMQGRLSPLVNGKIQAFPVNYWQKEFLAANKIDIRLMEWTLDQDGLYGNPLMTKSGRFKILSLMSKYNISIPSLTGDCFMQKPFWKASDSDRRGLENIFFDVIDACFLLKISNITIPLVDNGNLENDHQEKDLISFFSNISNFLSQKKINIAFESDFPPNKLAKLIEKLSPDTFGINYDIGNSASLGFDPVEEFISYGKRIINVHVKDRMLNGGTVPLGAGNADFPIVFGLLSKFQYKGNFILQTARAKNNDHCAVIELYKNMILDWMINYNE